MKMKMLLIMCILVAISIIFMSYASCSDGADKSIKFSLGADEELSGKIKVTGEPQKKIHWEIQNNEKDGKIETKIVVNNKEVLKSMDLKGEYKFKESNTEVIVRFINKSKKNIEFKAKCKYTYLGMAGIAMTVTKKIILNNH